LVIVQNNKRCPVHKKSLTPVGIKPRFVERPAPSRCEAILMNNKGTPHVYVCPPVT